ncbi:acid protease [Ganoderma leucocontextum]|nr:acid protease [Ganoderma leucocontextum]
MVWVVILVTVRTFRGPREGEIEYDNVFGEAKRLVPPPHQIHRTHDLQARKTQNGHISGIRRRALDAIGVPLDDFFLGTDLQWFGNISVGTPPQPVSVVFDTGSQTLEFAETGCKSCAQINPSKSSTFKRGTRKETLPFPTGVGVDPIVDNDYVLTIQSATDSVTVGGITLEKVSLTIIDQTAAFNPTLFSMFLTPHTVGNAELIIGGVDNSKFTGDLVWADQSGQGDWVVSSTAITVNGQTTDVLDQPRDIIFDSGTSNVLFSTQIAEAMYALISADIQPFDTKPSAYDLPYDKIGDLPAVIDIAFTARDGEPFTLTIPSTELNVGRFKSDPSTCQTLINSFDGLDLVGGSVLKHYYSVWDVGNQRMGFAPTENSPLDILAHLPGASPEITSPHRRVVGGFGARRYR